MDHLVEEAPANIDLSYTPFHNARLLVYGQIAANRREHEEQQLSRANAMLWMAAKGIETSVGPWTFEDARRLKTNQGPKIGALGVCGFIEAAIAAAVEAG
jgi:hypothetical protein